MKRKFLVVLLSIVATFCLAFGFAACGETENSGTGGGSQTEQPGGSQNGNQGNQGSGGTTKPDEGQGGEEKPDGGQGGNQGGEEKPDKPTEPEKPAEKQIEVKVYIDNVLTETLYTSASKGYKIALPAKPEDMTTDPELKNYFDGWYADKGYNEPLTGEETYSAPSAIYGRNITSRMNDFSYTVNYGEATITRFTNSTATTVVVPRYINSFPVTTIGREAFQNKTMLRTVFLCEGLKEIDHRAFYNCNSMQKVVLPSSLTLMEGSTFEDCSSLQSVTIPEKVTSIGTCTFKNCIGLMSVVWNAENCTAGDLYYVTSFEGCTNLKTVTFGKNVKIISDYVFYGCSGLQSVSIPDSVTSIGDHAFSGCSGLTSVTIGNSVTLIGDYAFSGCSGLEKFVVDEGNTIFSSQDGILYDKAKTKIILIPEAIKGAVAIPDSVTSIGEWAFNRHGDTAKELKNLLKQTLSRA